MAGYRVVWASEFVEAARDTYRANAASHTVVDPRDIREVTADSVLTAAGLRAGELDILDGSPPCASFSAAGNRDAGWGRTKRYSDTVQRTDDLFYEYARLVEGLGPRVFVAENVSGLVKGTAKGYFQLIMRRFKGCGYRVAVKLLDAAWLGVPQCRQRLIFVGVRDDLGADPVFPRPLSYRYTVRDALRYPTVSDGMTDPETGQDLDISRSAIGREWRGLRPGESSQKYFQLTRVGEDRPCPTITARAGCLTAAGPTHPTMPRKFNLRELRSVCGFPSDFVLTGSYEQRWERCGRAVPPPLMYHVATAVRDGILLPRAGRG